MAKKEPKIGTNIAQYKEAMVQWQQAMTEAQSNIAFWEEVKAVASQRNQPTEETAPVAEVEEQAEETTEAEQPTEETAKEVTLETEDVTEEQTPMAEDTQSVAETQAETTEEQSAEEESAEEEVAEETSTEEQPSAETAEEQPQAEQTEEVTEEYINEVIDKLRDVYESLANEAQTDINNNLESFKAELSSRTDEEIASAIADIESTPILGKLFERIRNGLLSGEIKRTEQEEQDLINALQRIAQGNVAKDMLLPILKAEQQKRAEQQAESKTEPQPKAKAKPKATPKATPKTTAKAKTPKRKKEVNFFKYILPKKERELRPVLAGVFMRDGYRVASDTHIPIAERAEYSPALEGRVINEDGIALVDKEGNPIINNLAWQRVIPTPENSSLVLTSIESIMAMLEQAKPLNKIFADDAPYNGNTATEIEIETENGPAFFDSAKLALFMDFVLTIDSPTLAYGNKTRSIWVTSADGSKKAVLMGLASESDRVDAIRISTRKGIEVGADFSYNNKKTNGLKSELKESEDYIALMKAQPVPPRRELSFHEKKVAQLKALIAIREGKTEFHVGDYVTPNSTQAQQLATKAVMMVLTENRLEPIIATDAMAEAVLGDNVELSVKKKRAPETAYVQEEHHPTVVSSADGAKVLKNLDSAISEYEKKSNQSKTFLGDVAKAIKAEKHGSNSQYATFETVNGKVVTIRLANHNAKVSNFDKNKEPEGISIVVSSEVNSGTNNDGKAHVVEFYYNALKLRRSKDKPLVEIIRSIKQALYSGEFKDTTGLAEREEVNGIIEFLRTPQGTIYGWTDGKRIYLTRDGMNPETPVHEYTHLWARAMMQNNAEGWQSIKDLLRDTPMWNEVLNDVNYANIRGNEDAIASEVLSRLSGKNGAQKMTDMAQQLINEGNPQAQTLIGRIRQALQEFWNWVGVNLFDIQNFESIEQVTDRVLWDMVQGTNLGMLESGGVEFMGSRVEKRRAEIAEHFNGQQLSGNSLSIVNAFAYGSKNEVIEVNGKRIVLKQGNENKAGVSHSLMRHYGTSTGNYSADELLLMPQVIEQGERKQDGKKVSYKMDINGVTYSVTTEIKGQHEEFTNFFTNRRPTVEEQGSSNTVNQHEQPQQSVSADEVTNNSSNTQEDGELLRPENSATDSADSFTTAAQQMADALGVEIEIDESIPAKGSYNPRTGRIRINPSRHATAEDVQRTVLHETIGHGGIQAVAGKRFGQVCQQVYDMMTEEPRSLLCQKHQ